ncbi:hypothetical protein [Gimesia sp.]|uniref:hypothetical protein n=1 Tax=Gimesia sp. TaxID=2024833 RepID=UPI000C45799D|nr:hypothetical protein [Gimesia sp.]MAX38601.1 hypothetical protein [Gimesia sp.]HAH47735.1 hypothetical protein [Planctomycetaceae bacterium]HBL47837.1 hypothetical protein [Planctomycetaceae bacterium]|tara:strand:- start:302 stop:613 length:312 start_codon:yes stop_codon:yes gene_type:complete
MLRSSLISEFKSGVRKELMMYRMPLLVIQATILLFSLFSITQTRHTSDKKPWNVVFFLSMIWVGLIWAVMTLTSTRREHRSARCLKHHLKQIGAQLPVPNSKN